MSFGMEQNSRKWRLEDIMHFFANSLAAIVKGQFIMRLKIDQYFPQIAWTFFLFIILILFSLMVDKTMVKVENNKKEITEKQITLTQKRYEFIRLTRRSAIARSLELNNSRVTEPVKPASVLKD